MTYVLIVALLGIEAGWIVKQDKQELPMKDLATCEAAQREIDKKMRAEKGAQFYTICRPRGSAA